MWNDKYPVAIALGSDGAYYNPTHGRFTSVDPLTASATIRNPQTLNRYSYALNSPYKFTDPLGLLSQYTTGACGGSCPNSDPNNSGGGWVGSSYGMSGDWVATVQAAQGRSPKKVYIFVMIDKSEQQESGTVTTTTKVGKKTTTTTRPIVLTQAPDFASLQKNAPKGTEVIVKDSSSTLDDFQNALKDEGAAVIFLGHGASDSPNATPFVAEGISLSDYSYTSETSVNVKASLVAVFGCDTKSTASLFAGAADLILTDSGNDGKSGAPALAQAAYATSAGVIAGKSAATVAASANAAYIRTEAAKTRRIDGQRVRFGGSGLLNGDKIVRVP